MLRAPRRGYAIIDVCLSLILLYCLRLCCSVCCTSIHSLYCLLYQYSFIVLSVSFCLDYCKGNQPTSLKLGIMIATASRKNALTFASIQIPGSLFHFPHHRKILRDLLAVLVQSPAGFRDTRRNDKVMNPHFERDPGDI